MHYETTTGYALNQNNFLKKYLFRKDFFWKVKERVYRFIRNNSRNAFIDQKRLLNNIENGVILDVGSHVGDTTELYRKYFFDLKLFVLNLFRNHVML